MNRIEVEVVVPHTGMGKWRLQKDRYFVERQYAVLLAALGKVKIIVEGELEAVADAVKGEFAGDVAKLRELYQQTIGKKAHHLMKPATMQAEIDAAKVDADKPAA